jgi:dTDP-4-amino-4,6-dideoxygalactose transaminase
MLKGMKVPFNRPYLSGREEDLIKEVLASGDTGSGGRFYNQCKSYLEQEFNYPFAGMTHNCTLGLEMSAFLLGLKPGDEVILPSYAYVTTANAFARYGAELKFADSLPDHPNIDPSEIERLISTKTKAIVVLHYGGSCCDMDRIMAIADVHGIPVIEDAAHALGVKWKDRFAGSFGLFGAISFHETKNIQCGEGGAFICNHTEWKARIENYLEHGTNRIAFEKGEVNRYEWTGIGSAVKPSEISMAALWAQLPDAGEVARKRRGIANQYKQDLLPLAGKGFFTLLSTDENCQSNGHIFAIVLNSAVERKALSKHLEAKGINAYLHFGALHASPFFRQSYSGQELRNARRFEAGLLRLPVYPSLKEEEQDSVITAIRDFF